MEGLILSPALIAAALVVLYLVSSIQILAEYERGVIFRLGKLLPHTKGPGVVLIFRPIDRIVRISLRTVVHDVPPQDTASSIAYACRATPPGGGAPPSSAQRP